MKKPGQHIEAHERVASKALADLAEANRRLAVQRAAFAESSTDRERKLEAELAGARSALGRIAEYDTDYTVGPAENVNRLQAIAEDGLMGATPDGPKCPTCGAAMLTYTLSGVEAAESFVACPDCGPPESMKPRRSK